MFEETLAQEAAIFYVVESELFFKQYAFHKQKILFHRASMRAFADRLRATGKTVEYIDSLDPRASEVALVSSISGPIALFDPNDYLLERRLRRVGEIQFLASPNFLNTDTSLLGTRKPYFQTAFYTQQRKDRGILLEEDGKPMGGQWTFDADNRKKIPKNTFIPAPFPETAPNEYILEAIDYVSAHFSENPGSLACPFSGAYYPVTHDEAQAALDQFIRERIPLFGDYEDAIKAQEKTLFHSILSPLINVGLLNPAQVIERVAASAAPLNSVEGFIRQVLGWREFIRGVYWLDMPHMAEANHYGHTRDLPKWYWTGETHMACMQATIGQSLQHGYAHHIQRLMVTGQFAVLAGLSPQQVSAWYRAMYVDAVEWVETPNTLGMALHANGGRFTSKPYVASGQYVSRMSNYCKGCRYQPEVRTGPSACPMTTLYWDFLIRHEKDFSGNPRTALMVKHVAKMSDEDRAQIRTQADATREGLDGV